ncbi:uncharacterized protein LACBIDRAFT_311287 [Laccaria bicolor S238N-H82]|uniref:Predicted protein n=1 Tax=Laccaria bicolor (strain S238N-H82 / ATCC MYA-4686) TaxID=486041 RepID=B0CZN4_LACBS|nr:uncharacterized protein LACBIDRAFT_311287 [Laccaria bicolor S238N-H82]EDR12650.1 predicted protein [Laccaria bicolor S238N-H82]|eukprot:XP_001876914.1 predicted protein [Laccaria bicolor S238N-H82]
MGRRNRALTQSLCLLESISVPHPISSRSPSHLLRPLSQFTDFSYAKHASRKRCTVQNYPPLPTLIQSSSPVLPPSSMAQKLLLR